MTHIIICILHIMHIMHLHSTETSISSKRETSKTSEIEVVAVNPDKVILEATGQLVAAKGGAQKGVGAVISLLGKHADDLGLELFVGKGSRECTLDHSIKFRIKFLIRFSEFRLDLFELGV